MHGKPYCAACTGVLTCGCSKRFRVIRGHVWQRMWAIISRCQQISGVYSVCRQCGATRQLHHKDGNVHKYGPRDKPCPGSNKPPLCVSSPVRLLLFVLFSAATYFGPYILLFQEGPQQGDRLGSLLFCCAINSSQFTAFWSNTAYDYLVSLQCSMFGNALCLSICHSVYCVLKQLNILDFSHSVRDIHTAHNDRVWELLESVHSEYRRPATSRCCANWSRGAWRAWGETSLRPTLRFI